MTMTLFPFLRFALIAASLLGTASCNYLPDWMGKEDNTPILPGERVSLQQELKPLASEIAPDSLVIRLPDASARSDWTQAQAVESNVADHLALPVNITPQQHRTLGDGEAYNSQLVPSPIVVDGVLYTLSSTGMIEAVALPNLQPIWQSAALRGGPEAEVEVFLGGGVASDAGRLFGVNDEGRIIALNRETGEKIWQRDLVTITHSPPRVAQDLVLIATADNQLIALNSSDGSTRWIHEQITESATPLQAFYPAIGNSQLLMTYSSGDVVMLDLATGALLWQDELVESLQNRQFGSGFGHFNALITPYVSFAGTPNGFAAFLTRNGRRIWDRDLRLQQTPWLAGTTLYAITTDNQLAAINGTNGQVFWVQQLPASDELIWQRPFVASDKVWVIGSGGAAYLFDAISGNPEMQIPLPEAVMAPPVVVNESLILVSRGGELTLLQVAAENE